MFRSKKVLMGLMVVVLLFTACFGNNIIFTDRVVSAAVTPVSYYGEMTVSGNHINGSKIGRPMQVEGMSFFWSNWSGPWWNAPTVDRMVDEFKCEIVRAAYGVDDSGTPYNSADESKVRDVVNQAIARGIYVIIDWHSHGAYNNVNAAKDFFGRMAQQFGSYDNVIFELFNEPLQIPWSTVKSYAEQVIPVIRQYSNNLIVVGTPTWSQDVDQASYSPITSSSNIAYTLHFYAGTHFQSLRDKGNTAMNNGLAIFTTEWGSCNADGNGAINYSSTSEWLTWLDNNKISWCNWTINDKAETSSIFYSNGTLTEAGNYLKSILANHATTAEWRNSGSTPTPTPTPTGGPTPSASPITIEAENYAYMSGVQTEACSEGGSNVGYIDPGDWMSYSINLPSAGAYTVEYRVASLNGGGVISLEQNSGQVKLGTVNVPSTGGWQNWTTISHNVTFASAGVQDFGIGVPTGGYNLNWIKFTKINGSTATPTPTPKPNMIQNPEFDNGTNNWGWWAQSPAAGSISVVTGQGLSGTNSLKVSMSNGGTIDWHGQLSASTISITSGKTYTISFMGKADASRSIRMVVRQGISPYTEYFSQTVNLTTSPTTYGSFTYNCSNTDSTAQLMFFTGNSITSVYLDKVTMTSN